MAQTDVFNLNSDTYFGCEYYADNTLGVGLNSSSEYVALGIKPLVSKTVTSIQVLNWSIGGTAQSTTVELRSDNGSGLPSSTILTSGTFTPTASFTWNSVSVTSFSVTAGTQYWIVVHGAGYTATNTLNIRGIDDPGAILTSRGYQYYASGNSGSTWGNQGATFTGCVGFGYSDSTFEGQAYGDFDTNNIANTSTTQWGEYFNPGTTFSASAVGMTIFKNAAGTPTADCTVVVQNADTSTTLETGTIVTAAAVTQTATWYTFTFSQTRTFTAGTNYRVYLTSGATSSPQFTIRTPKTTNTGNGNAMSFGGTTDVRTNSSVQSSDHEATFRLTLSSSSAKILTLLGVG